MGKFACKCDKCRRVCCGGWGITLSEKEYFTLLGLSCSHRLRRKLDCAFEPLPLAEPGRYARVLPDYEGNCPMLDTDGYCLLQKERGEGVLPLVCRVYPRSVKNYGDHIELCVSNSCEKTIELLCADREPLRLVPVALEPPFEGIRLYTADREKDAVRYRCVALMEDRTRPVGERLIKLCDELRIADTAPVTSETGAAAMGRIRTFLRTLTTKSRSIGDCGGKALAHLGDCDDATAYERFLAANRRLYTLIPHIEDYAEKIIVNHMIYEGFPYIPDAGTVESAFSAFCFSVALLKFICVLGMADSEDFTDMVDLMSEAYRFVEHSAFYSLCSNRLHPDCRTVLAELLPLIR